MKIIKLYFLQHRLIIYKKLQILQVKDFLIKFRNIDLMKKLKKIFLDVWCVSIKSHLYVFSLSRQICINKLNQKTKIVQSWYKTLTLGSIWEFNLEHHLGNRIPLNHLLGLSYRNKEHPSGYIFVMEQFGDRREQIERTSDNDIFSGYSASKTNFEFTHKLGYLTQHSLTDIENEQSVVY